MQSPQQKPSFSPVLDLYQFATTYQNEKLRPSLTQLSNTCPSYRAVRGDGDCFYRAVIFLYLMQCSFDKYDRVFHTIEVETRGTELSIPSSKRMPTIYYYWKECLLPLCSLSRNTKEDKLAALFNTQPLFDRLMVGYLRSLTTLYVSHNAHCFDNYMVGTVDFNVFKRETEEMEIKACALALGVAIKVMVVMENTLTHKTYGTGTITLTLFYRPGHYDIVYQHKHTNSSSINNNANTNSNTHAHSTNNKYAYANSNTYAHSNNNNYAHSNKNTYAYANNNNYAYANHNSYAHSSNVSPIRSKQPIPPSKKYQYQSIDTSNTQHQQKSNSISKQAKSKQKSIQEQENSRKHNQRPDLNVPLMRKVIEVCGLAFMAVSVFQLTKLLQ